MPTVNFKLLHRLLETSARLGHYLEYHLNDSVVPSNAWNPNVIITVCQCLKSSKRSIKILLICLESKLGMTFYFYCDCANKRSNFCLCLNILQQYYLRPARLDYERGCLETGDLMSYLEAHGHNEWNELPQASSHQRLQPFKPNLASTRTDCCNIKELCFSSGEAAYRILAGKTEGGVAVMVLPMKMCVCVCVCTSPGLPHTTMYCWPYVYLIPNCADLPERN